VTAKRPRPSSSSAGFTLIELLIVILVIGILIAVAAPSFFGQTGKAQDSAAEQQLVIAYKAAKADSVENVPQGAWKTGNGLASVIESAEPQLGDVAVGTDPGDGSLTVTAGSTTANLKLEVTSASGRVCTLEATANAQMTVGCGPPPPPLQVVFENVNLFTGDTGVYAVNDDGTGLAKLADGFAPAYVLGGAKIGFLRTEDSGDVGVYTMNPDGSGVAHLVDLPACDNSQARCWDLSPDGSKVVFAQAIPAGRDEVFTINVDGSGLTQITDLLCGGGLAAPRWSPGGTKIAFTGCNGNTARVSVMNPDGSGITELADGWAPAWSPDGSKIAFDVVGGISLMDADGSSVSTVVSSGRFPAWSPDGTKIAFVAADPDGPSGGFSEDVSVVVLDGGGRTRLTNNDFTESAIYPTW
jgi:prepilin-type N-terminal cleavage/methylation domain-containing protein